MQMLTWEYQATFKFLATSYHIKWHLESAKDEILIVSLNLTQEEMSVQA